MSDGLTPSPDYAFEEWQRTIDMETLLRAREWMNAQNVRTDNVMYWSTDGSSVMDEITQILGESNEQAEGE